MKLEFILDDVNLTGIAKLFDFESFMWFLISIDKSSDFTLYMGEDGYWESDIILPKGLASALGSEIEILDSYFDSPAQQPRSYVSL